MLNSTPQVPRLLRRNRTRHSTGFDVLAPQGILSMVGKVVRRKGVRSTRAAVPRSEEALLRLHRDFRDLLWGGGGSWRSDAWDRLLLCLFGLRLSLQHA